MNRISYILLTVVIFLSYSTSVFSVELASRNPQPRNVVLEEYTGIHCVYCPDGHKRAKALKEANPGRVVLINVHAGNYAVPNAGEPDFRTAFGEQLVAFASVSGFPAGSVNRIVYPGAANSAPYTPQKAGGTALSRGGWAKAAADSVLNGSISPVNIGAKTIWANSSRELNVDLELYFTSAISGAVKLNVVLLESHVWGPQTGGEDPKNYEHNFIMRHMLTGQWGEQITATTQGSAVTKNYKYTVPANIKIENCDIAVFVTSGTNQYIYTGITQPAITPDASITTTGAIIDAKNVNETFNQTFALKNNSERAIEFSYSVAKSNRTPADWQAKTTGVNSKFTLAAGETANIEVSLTLGATLGVGDAILTISEVGNPDALSYSSMITAVSAGAKYLEIDYGGTIENVVKDGGRTSTISLKGADFNSLASKLNPKVVVWNYGPRGEMNASQANTMLAMINKGIGVLVNGSVPIPFLTFENASHPLLSKLGITWTDANNINLNSFTIEGIAGDPIADGLKVVTTPTNNGYLLQSINITNPNIAFPMIKNTDQDKTVSVRIEAGTSRVVYLSFNLDIISNATEKTNLIKKAIDWLEATTGVEDETSESITIYPNPASEYVIVNGLNGIATINDIFGRTIWTGEVTNGTQIPVAGISTGMYMININNKVFKFVKE